MTSNPQKIADYLFAAGKITAEDKELIYEPATRSQKSTTLFDLLLIKDGSAFVVMLEDGLKNREPHLYAPLKKVYGQVTDEMSPEDVKVSFIGFLL